MARSLADRLGYQPGMRGLIEAAEGSPPLDIATADAGPYACLLFFVRTEADIAAVARRLDALYSDGSRLWIAYPKKSGSIATTVSRDRGWDAISDRAFLGVAQVAIDATWSALRFRRRHEIKTLTRHGAV